MFTTDLGYVSKGIPNCIARNGNGLSLRVCETFVGRQIGSGDFSIVVNGAGELPAMWCKLRASSGRPSRRLGQANAGASAASNGRVMLVG